MTHIDSVVDHISSQCNQHIDHHEMPNYIGPDDGCFPLLGIRMRKEGDGKAHAFSHIEDEYDEK